MLSRSRKQMEPDSVINLEILETVTLKLLESSVLPHRQWNGVWK